MQAFLKDIGSNTPVRSFDAIQPDEVFTKVGRLALERLETVVCCGTERLLIATAVR